MAILHAFRRLMNDKGRKTRGASFRQVAELGVTTGIGDGNLW